MKDNCKCKLGICIYNYLSLAIFYIISDYFNIYIFNLNKYIKTFQF